MSSDATLLEEGYETGTPEHPKEEMGLHVFFPLCRYEHC
jgi:hypothetical protein